MLVILIPVSNANFQNAFNRNEIADCLISKLFRTKNGCKMEFMI
jgi:hypothetical protein